MPSEVLLSLFLGSRGKTGLRGTRPAVSYTAPSLQKPMFCLIFYCHDFEILNNSWIRGPTFSVCTGSCRFCSGSCQEYTLPLQLSAWSVGSCNCHHSENLLFSFSFPHAERKTSRQGGFGFIFSTVGWLINPLPGQGKPLRTDYFSSLLDFSFTLSPSPQWGGSWHSLQHLPIPSKMPILAGEKLVLRSNTLNHSNYSSVKHICVHYLCILSLGHSVMSPWLWPWDFLTVYSHQLSFSLSPTVSSPLGDFTVHASL